MSTRKAFYSIATILIFCTACVTTKPTELTPEQGAAREAICVAARTKAAEFGVLPFMVYRANPKDNDLHILDGSLMKIDRGRVTFEDNTLIVNAGPTPILFGRSGWQRTLQEREFILIKDGKIAQSGMIE